MFYSDTDTVVENELPPGLIARYFKLAVISWNSFISLRMELYGCPVAGLADNYTIEC